MVCITQQSNWNIIFFCYCLNNVHYRTRICVYKYLHNYLLFVLITCKKSYLFLVFLDCCSSIIYFSYNGFIILYILGNYKKPPALTKEIISAGSLNLILIKYFQRLCINITVLLKIKKYFAVES